MKTLCSNIDSIMKNKSSLLLYLFLQASGNSGLQLWYDSPADMGSCPASGNGRRHDA